jgi:hypothetical protein
VGRQGFEPWTKRGLKARRSTAELTARTVGGRLRLLIVAPSLMAGLARRGLNPRAPATLPAAYKAEGIRAIGSERGCRPLGLLVMGQALC